MTKLTVAVVLAAAGAAALPAAAHSGHASCKGFGELVSGAAQFAAGFGGDVSQNARAGFIPEIVAGYHGAFCEPTP